MQPNSTRPSRPRTSRPEFVLALVIAVLAGTPETRADQNDPRLDQLFATLAGTSDLHAALQTERVIWQIWLSHDDPRIQAAITRSTRRMDERRYVAALEELDALVAMAPEFAEAWNKRATVLYILGEYERSVADIAATLQLEPRHFGALSGLALIYDAIGQPLAASQALRQALEIYPAMAMGDQRLRQLERESGRSL